MSSKEIYWRYEELLTRQNVILDSWKGSIRNKRLIKAFQNHLSTTATKQARIAKITWSLRTLCNLLRSDLDVITKTDVECVVASIQNSRYTENTKSDHKRALKHFYRWFQEEDARLESKDDSVRKSAEKAYKYIQTHVKTTVKQKDIDPGSTISDEEIQKVISTGCKTAVERAFIKTLHESGCRIGELLSIHLKDIQPKENIWLIRVTGKTGERQVPLLYSIPYLLVYLEFHPDKGNPQSPLWICNNNRFIGQPLRYAGARHLINRCFVGAGILKQHNPHWFRHSRATIDAPQFSDSLRCQMRGWTQGSQMVRRYTHMSGKQVEDAFQLAHGLVKTEEVKREAKPMRCVCDAINPAEAKYCYKCGKALSIGVALLQQEHMDLAFKLYEKILSNPELKIQYDEFKKKNEGDLI